MAIVLSRGVWEDEFVVRTKRAKVSEECGRGLEFWVVWEREKRKRVEVERWEKLCSCRQQKFLVWELSRVGSVVNKQLAADRPIRSEEDGTEKCEKEMERAAVDGI